MKRRIKADFIDVPSLIPVYQPVDPEELAPELDRHFKAGRG